MRIASTLLFCATAVSIAPAQESLLPPAPKVPALRIDLGGPAAPVSALAFAPDGTLYVGGHDKRIRAYRHDAERKTWAESRTLRVPIGPGNSGAINTLAVSPDGLRLAVAGRAPMRDESNLAEPAIVIDPNDLPASMRRDVGVIYLMDPANPNRGSVLRGHLGPVLALSFGPPVPNGEPVLVSAAIEPDPTDTSKSTGVIRLWDTTTGQLLATRTGFPTTPTRPGLAAYPGPNGTLQVAIAWQNADPRLGGDLVIWDPKADTITRHADGAMNLALLTRGDNGQTEIVSGSFANFGKKDDQYGRLSVRPATDPTKSKEIAFRPQEGTHFLPLAVAAAGKSLAVLLETVSQMSDRTQRPAEVRLLGTEVENVGRLPLTGLSRSELPVLASSADGNWLAVGGFRTHRVELYRVADIAAGNAKPNTLPGAPAGYGNVAFLKGQKLWLGSSEESPKRGGTIVDLVGRKVAVNNGTGEVDVPKLPGSVEFDTTTLPRSVKVTIGDRTTRILLRGNEVPTASVLIPGPGDTGPLVVVAHTDAIGRSTLISLFDAATGRRVRQLIGPEQPVRSLAVAGSRPLLAAVGDDGLLHVWSLKTLGKETGAIEGLHVSERDGKVVVARIDAAAPAEVRDAFQPGDVLTAVGAEKGKPESPKTPAEFLFAVRSRPVGSKVAVTVAGKAAPIVVSVGRAVEQQGPLFSLWIGPDKPGQPREWVGWNPNGPYDFSTPAAEARIGWVSNTGDPAHPVRFAGADQYRKQYHKRDFLRFLADTGDLSAAEGAYLDAYPPAELKVQVDVTGTEPGPGNRPMLRGQDVNFVVRLDGVSDGYPLDDAVLRTRITRPGAEPVITTIPLKGGTLRHSFDLADHRWSRGIHRFEAWFQRTPTAPLLAANSTEVVFVPPAPKLAVLVNGKLFEERSHATMTDSLSVGAIVKSAVDTAVSASVSAPDGSVKVEELALGKDGQSTPVSIKLLPGTTSVRLRAVNAGEGVFDELESAETSFTIVYTKPEVVLPPNVSELTLARPCERRVIDAKTVAIVAEAEPTVRTTITAEKPLTAVEWDAGDGKWQAVPIDPKSPKSLKLEQTARLEPGQIRTIRVRAQVDRAEPSIASLDLVYHPMLPTVTVEPILSGPTTDRRFTAQGTFDKMSVRAPFRVYLVAANGNHVRRADVVPDVAAGTWTAAVALDPGVNAIGMMIENDWRSEERANLATVTFRRPAKIAAVAPVDAGDTAVAAVAITAITDDDPELVPTTILVNGEPIPTPQPATKIFSFFGTAWWTVTAPAVPVKVGDDWRETITIAARNADGDSTSARVPVKHRPKPPTPPVMLLADGSADRTTEKPDLPIAFRVVSESALTRVAVLLTRPGQEEPVLIRSFNPNTAEKTESGFTLSGEATAALRPGMNRIRLLAVNAGGETAIEFTASYTEPALQIVIDAVEELSPGGRGELLVRESGESGVARYGVAKSGFVAVRGRVLWTGDDVPHARNPALSAVLSVNQVNHLPVQVGLASGRNRERIFIAPVFLNAADSLVRIELRAPGRAAAIPLERLGSAEIEIACSKPIGEQRLHVVAVGVDVPREERFQLVKDMIVSLGGQAPGPVFDAGEFRHPAFDRAYVYPPVVGTVDDGRVAWALDEVDRQIRRSSTSKPDGWLNDVILLYYQGRDWVGGDGRHWLHTSRSLKYPPAVAQRFAVDVAALPDTPGVRLVLLNVVNPDHPTTQMGTEDTAGGPPLIRYEWSTQNATRKLLDHLAIAVNTEGTLGDVIDTLAARVGRDPAKAGDPFHRVPDPIEGRRFGIAGLKP